MPFFRVLIREVHVSHRMVEAETAEEAMEEAGECEEHHLEFSHTLDTDEWTVEGPIAKEDAELETKNDDETNG